MGANGDDRFSSRRRVASLKRRHAAALQIQADVQGDGGMGEGADGDAVDAGLGDGADGGEVDAAGGFQGGGRGQARADAHDFSRDFADALARTFARAGNCVPAGAGGVAEGDGLAHGGEIHVVQEDGVDAADLEDFAKLVQRVYLDLNEAGGGLGSTQCDDLAECIGQFGEGNGGEVVVLDQQAVIEAHAMVQPAAATDGVLFQQAVAGGGFAGVIDAGSCALDGIDEATGLGGDAGEALDEIEDDALSGKQRTERAGDQGQGATLLVGIGAFEGFQGLALDRLDR